MSGPCADASDPRAAVAAERAFQAGGNSVDAVLAGFFVAAAMAPNVLFSSVVVLVAGVGAAPRLIDGRACQPGLEHKRPRGLRPDELVPPQARASVPRSLGALALLHAYGGKRPLSAAVRPAVAAAKKAGAPRRARVLERIARSGAATLTHSNVERALIGNFGPIAGGLLTAADLAAARPDDRRLAWVEPNTLMTVARCPALEGADDGRPRRPAHVMVAADPNGRLCALAYCPDPEALVVPELELSLSAEGVPVRRGVARVTPQTPLASAAPLAIARRASDGWQASVAACQPAPLDAGVFGAGLSLHQIVAALHHNGARCALAASIERRKTRLTRAG